VISASKPVLGQARQGGLAGTLPDPCGRLEAELAKPSKPELEISWCWQLTADITVISSASMTTTPTPTVPPTDIEDVPSPLSTESTPSSTAACYSFNADGTCFVPRTWENITPEQYEAIPLIGGWPWCEPGTVPSSYKWEAPCGPDPCIPSGTGSGSLLWAVAPCTPAAAPVTATTVATVATAEPPSLPETGPSATGWIGGIGTFCLVAGIGLTLVKRWERPSRSAR
jgi:LPXTG-motif cell wall-anchored protein